MRSGWRLLTQVVWLIVLTIVLSIPIGMLGMVNQHKMIDLLFGEIISLLAVILSVFLARRLLDRRRFRSLGFEFKPGWWQDLLFGIGLTGLIMGLIYLVEWQAGWLHFSAFAWQDQTPSRLALDMLIVLFLFVVVGIGEELFYRGYQLQNLADGLNLTWGVILSSVIFAVSHLGNPHASLQAVLGLIGAGLFLAYGYVGRRNLWLPIGLHIGWNLFEGPVFGFQVSGLDFLPHIIRQTVNGPEVITGGSFGPEAGLIVLPALVLGAVCIYFYARWRNSKSEALLYQ